MFKEKLLKKVRNAKSKLEIIKWLGLNNNGRDSKKMVTICLDNDIIFSEEFSKNVIKYNNCLECNKIIKLSKKFCNRSCSVTFNNKKRILTNETKIKISKCLINKYKNGLPKPKGKIRGVGVKGEFNYDSINDEYVHNCMVCGIVFRTILPPKSSRKTCSRECQTKAIFKNRGYQNGSRKTYKYYNKYINKEVILESSWELKVAKLLDKLEIFWIRPDSLDWIDDSGVTRQYFSDFYLNEYDTYLDPKNPYCMELDKCKLKYIEERYNIIYGDLKYVVSEVYRLRGVD